MGHVVMVMIKKEMVSNMCHIFYTITESQVLHRFDIIFHICFTVDTIYCGCCI